MTRPLAAATSSASATIVASSSRPVWSSGPAEVDERRETGAADRHVHHPATPRATEGVGDDDGHVHAEPRRERRADPLRRAVGVLRQQGQEPGLDVGGVDAGVRAHEAVLRLGDHDVVAPRHDASGLALDPRRAPVPLLGHDASLRLGDDLLRHDDDVAVADSGGRERAGEHRREIVAGPDLRDALDGQDLDPHDSRSSATRASASAFASSVMIESVTPTRTPVASIRGASPRSASSTTHAASSPR